MKNFIIIACIVILLSSCTVCTHETNQKERQRIFKECMEILPAWPVETVYNDWDEVVAECDNVAYYQAREKTCK